MGKVVAELLKSVGGEVVIVPDYDVVSWFGRSDESGMRSEEGEKEDDQLGEREGTKRRQGSHCCGRDAEGKPRKQSATRELLHGTMSCTHKVEIEEVRMDNCEKKKNQRRVRWRKKRPDERNEPLVSMTVPGGAFPLRSSSLLEAGKARTRCRLALVKDEKEVAREFESRGRRREGR